MSTSLSLPDDRRAHVEPGQTLLDALRQADVPIVHACGGHARCSTCRVRVVAGLEGCTPRTDDEQRMADRIGLVSFDATLALALSWPFLLIACVVTAAAIPLFKRRRPTES